MGTGYTGGQFGQWWNEGQWTWQLKFAWLPARMDSGQWIWFKEYYRGVRMIHGPELPVYLYQYMTPQEYTWHCLTQR